MKTTALLLATLLTVTAATRAEDSSQAAARNIFKQHQDCVIHVSAVAKTSFSADNSGDAPVNVPDKENKVEALGTIIDPSGLIVTVLDQIDPGRMISGRSIRTSQGVIKLEASSVLKDIKAIMPDGTEIPAEILMKDNDLNLAFIRIKTASKEAKGVAISSVDLKHSAPGEILDDVVTLTRMDETLNRAATINRGQINTIIKKPRTFLRATGGTGGCPTFFLNGKILGITTGRSVAGGNPQAVIIPAADILEIADQAKNSKPVEANAPAKEKSAQ